MKLFSNLPDSDHVPYKFLTAEPHIKQVVRYMRTEDYLIWGGITTLFPMAAMLWGTLLSTAFYGDCSGTDDVEWHQRDSLKPTALTNSSIWCREIIANDSSKIYASSHGCIRTRLLHGRVSSCSSNVIM